jgi:hypothetical protein
VLLAAFSSSSGQTVHGLSAKLDDNPGFADWVVDSDLIVRGATRFRPDAGVEVQPDDVELLHERGRCAPSPRPASNNVFALGARSRASLITSCASAAASRPRRSWIRS